MNKKKGFSLLEVVVAILIVVIASSITLTVVLNTRKIMINSQAEVNAANEAENVIKAYYMIDDNDENKTLIKYLNFLHGDVTDQNCIYDGTSSYTIYYDKDFVPCEYSEYVFRIEFNTNNLSIKVLNTSDKVIYEYEA